MVDIITRLIEVLVVNIITLVDVVTVHIKMVDIVTEDWVFMAFRDVGLMAYLITLVDIVTVHIKMVDIVTEDWVFMTFRDVGVMAYLLAQSLSDWRNTNNQWCLRVKDKVAIIES